MSADDERPPGRREASKRATREALRRSAQTLFTAHGFRNTTVQEVAAAAGVTERTFFRYFGSKDELLAELVLGGLPLLQEAIVQRPADEPPLAAVRNAVIESLRTTDDDRRPGLAQMFEDGPPGLRLQPMGASLLLRFEAAIAEALQRRLGPASPATARSTADEPAPFHCEVLAAAAVAACRRALITNGELLAQGRGTREDLVQLVDEAFDALTQGDARPRPR